MICLLNNGFKENTVHTEIMCKTYANMCSRLKGLNTKKIMLVDTDGVMEVQEGDGEDENSYIVSIRFSNSFPGFMSDLIDALGFIIGGEYWMANLPDKSTKADILFSVYRELANNYKAVF